MTNETKINRPESDAEILQRVKKGHDRIVAEVFTLRYHFKGHQRETDALAERVTQLEKRLLTLGWIVVSAVVVLGAGFLGVASR